MVLYSIIIVTLNSGNELNDTILSILLQTYDNYEIIIKDGVSTDDSIRNIPKNDKIRVISKKDKGIYNAMNQAIEAARGSYCYFINAGDKLYSKNVLEEISVIIKMHRYPDMIFGYIFYLKKNIYIKLPNALDKTYLFNNSICHQAIFFKTNYIIKSGYDENLKVLADRDLTLRYFLKCNNIIKVNKCIAIYKGDGFSESNNAKNIVNKENKYIAKKFKIGFMRYIYKIYYKIYINLFS